MIASAVVSFFMLEPVYETNTTLIVNRNESVQNQNMTGDEYTVAQKLAVTYGEIIKSRTVLEEVITDEDTSLELVTSFDEELFDGVAELEVAPPQPVNANKVVKPNNK